MCQNKTWASFRWVFSMKVPSSESSNVDYFVVGIFAFRFRIGNNNHFRWNPLTAMNSWYLFKLNAYSWIKNNYVSVRFRLRNSICWHAGLRHFSRLADFLDQDGLFLLLRRFNRFRISLPAPKSNQLKRIRRLMSTSNMSVTRRVQRIRLTCTRQKEKIRCNLPLFVDRPPRDQLWMSRRPSAPRSRQSLVVTTPSLLLLTYLDILKNSPFLFKKKCKKW